MEQQVVYYINTFWDIIENWWWLCLPFVLYRPFLFLWLWWRWEGWDFKQKRILLEIKMPKEVLKPIRAMEQVFTALWGNVFDPSDWWEKWWEGKPLDSAQLEIVSLGGEPHLYIRCSMGRRNAIEASIYSQYPDAEISVAEDYTKNVPQGLPNKDWEIWGADYELVKDEVYPIKTYSKFFEEKPDTSKEEKRIDPMSTLLEGMGTFKPGEQLWIQMAIKPIIDSKNPFEGREFLKHGMEVRDKLAKRPEKAKPKSILGEAVEEFVTGKVPGASDDKKEINIEALLPVEARMTPGEKNIVQGIEEKIAKRCFDSHIRFIYLAKRDVYFGGAKAIPFGYFNQFATEDLNQLKPWSKTITKIHKYPILNLVRVRRLFVRKRRLFFRYIKRHPPLFPKPGGTFLLNTEEIATIFHFPGRTSAPAPFVSRVESKRGEAPPGLPLEE